MATPHADNQSAFDGNQSAFDGPRSAFTVSLAVSSTPAQIYTPGGVIYFDVTLSQPENIPFHNIFVDCDLGAVGGSPRSQYVPGSFTLISPDTFSGSVTQNQVLTFQFAPLSGDSAAGPVRSQFAVQVLPDQPSQDLVFSFAAYCQLWVDGSLEPAFQAAFVSFLQGPRALLTVNKTGEQDEVTPPVPFSYTLTVKNTGDANAQSVVITDALPARFTLTGVQGTSSQGDPVPLTYQLDPQTNLLTIPSPTGGPVELAAGDTLTVELTGEIQ